MDNGYLREIGDCALSLYIFMNEFFKACIVICVTFHYVFFYHLYVVLSWVIQFVFTELRHIWLHLEVRIQTSNTIAITDW